MRAIKLGMLAACSDPSIEPRDLNALPQVITGFVPGFAICCNSGGGNILSFAGAVLSQGAECPVHVLPERVID
jgi:hypothetical protein